MHSDAEPRARVSMFIDASPREVYRAFVEPAVLTQFWLSSASGPLTVGEPVEWTFMVPGAKDRAEATRLSEDRHIAWRWPDSSVEVDLEPFEGGTAITLINSGFRGSAAERVEAALNATEGFTIVLCDLKTLLEGGQSAGLTRAKARLIVARSGA